jgi:hypothetical protein
MSDFFHRTAYGRDVKLARKPDDNFRDTRENVDVLMPIEVRWPYTSSNHLPDLRPELELDVGQAHLSSDNSSPETGRRHMKPASPINEGWNMRRVGHRDSLSEIEVHSDTESMKPRARCSSSFECHSIRLGESYWSQYPGDGRREFPCSRFLSVQNRPRSQ